jgi:hypothetical protein
MERHNDILLAFEGFPFEVKNASVLFKCKNHQRFLIQYRGKHLKGIEGMEIDMCVRALGLGIGCQK